MISEAFVHARFADGSSHLVGRCRLAGRLGQFAYAGSWRENRHGRAFPLHPERMPLDGGEFVLRTRSQIGPLADSTPDSWGRRIVEALQRPEHRPGNGIEWLLASGDERVGCLAFSPTPSPPTVQAAVGADSDLGRFASAFAAIERGEAADPLSEHLFRAGASLGGARPKAVIAQDDQLWIAKFSRTSDGFDHCAAEHAAMRLAQVCGIDAAATRLANAGVRRAVLVQRFDRTPGPDFRPSAHYLSALSALDLDETAQGGSYAAIAGFLRRVSADHRADAVELFRRMVFNVLVGNRDDHLKNHAVLFRPGQGWRLSPAFDVMPQPEFEPVQAISVGRFGTAASLANCYTLCGEFGLHNDAARAVAGGIVERLRNWRPFFAAHGVDAATIRRLGGAFAPTL